MKNDPNNTVDINFLSEEDLDLVNLTDAELDAVWEAWFRLAQLTNEEDKDYYSHSCFGDSVPALELAKPS